MFNVIQPDVAFSLLMASCTSPSSAGRQATRPPETIEVEIFQGYADGH